MERRLSSQTMQQHSLPSFSGYLQTEVKGIPGGGRLGRPSPSSSPSPSLFLRHCLPNFTCPEVNLSSFRTPVRATNEVAGDPDQLWPAPPARAKAYSIPPGPGWVELPCNLQHPISGYAPSLCPMALPLPDPLLFVWDHITTHLLWVENPCFQGAPKALKVPCRPLHTGAP